MLEDTNSLDGAQCVNWAIKQQIKQTNLLLMHCYKRSDDFDKLWFSILKSSNGLAIKLATLVCGMSVSFSPALRVISPVSSGMEQVPVLRYVPGV